MNYLESQETEEFVGALQAFMEEQGMKHDTGNPYNDERRTIYTNGRITVAVDIEPAEEMA